MNTPPQLPAPSAPQPAARPAPPLRPDRSLPGTLRAAGIVAGVLRRRVAAPSRLSVIVSVGALFAAVVILAGRSSGSPVSATTLIDPVLTFVVPLIALFATAGGLNELIGDKTLVYLWLRPITRLSIALGSWSAVTAVAGVATAALAVAVPTGLLAGQQTNAPTIAQIAGLTVVAYVLAAAAFAALFGLFATLTRYSTALGLGYVIIWELTVARLAPGAGRLSVTGYAASVLANGRATTPGWLQNLTYAPVASAPTAAGALAIFSMVCVGATAWRLNRTEVA